MSLKAIHIFFISLAMLLLAGFGYWSWLNYAHTHATQYMIYLLLCLVSLIGLMIYLFKFIQKMKLLK